MSSGSGDFSCAICLEAAKEPVVTKCGHLFCWPCLRRWLHQSGTYQCAVCKGAINPDVVGNVIPVYGKGANEEEGVPGTTTPAPPTTGPSSSASSSSAQGFEPERPRGDREEQQFVPHASNGMFLLFFFPAMGGMFSSFILIPIIAIVISSLLMSSRFRAIVEVVPYGKTVVTVTVVLLVLLYVMWEDTSVLMEGTFPISGGKITTR